MDADRRAPDPLDEELVLEAVEMFRLLADETRVRLVRVLLDSELSVGQLAEAVGKPAPSVSQHLAKMRMARIVSTRRDGTFVYYRIDNDHVAQLVVDALRHAEHGRTTTPRHHLAGEPGAATADRENEEVAR